MPFRKIEPKTDFPALEREILGFWDESKAFEELRAINAGKPRWSFLDGPITANNPMGVHHAWGRTYKDVYQRYHAAIGRELRYQNGFDCQGLWVEVEVEKEHRFTSKRDIEAFGVDRFVEECKARARKFAAVQTEQSKRLGYWMDWDDSYYTFSDDNNYGIWAFLRKCHEKGLIYKGSDVMPWCPRCGTGISQMEMTEGYREVGHPSIFVTFPLRDRPGQSLLVWTTTPWTLTSNVAAAVHPDTTYVRVRVGDESCWVGKAQFESPRSHPIAERRPDLPELMAISALFRNRGPWTIEEEAPGSTLVGLAYDGPFDHLEGASEAPGAHRVIAWDLVSESEGTGIVHIAPGCGSEDYELGREHDLPRIAPLLEDGRFGPGFDALTGKRFDEVPDDVIEDLKRRGRLFARETYHHRYPHCWRCRAELVYRLVDEWFIDMSWREEIMDSTRSARWIPEWGMERELDWLRNMGDWMISKKRYWGLALPIWECGDCGRFEVIGGREDLEARAVRGWEEFDGHSPHRPWIDTVKIRCEGCGNEEVSRIADVGNPWLDASIVSLTTMGYFSDREYWEKWFPADFVVEALAGQFRNWFYALLAVSTMMVGRSPFKVLKGHGLVVDDEGKPMHKSTGNAIAFDEAAEDIGVDVMRWLFASTPPERNLLFGPVHSDEVRREVILPWWNVYAFFCNLARVDGFDPRRHTAEESERSLLDRWVLSELHRVVGGAHEAYSEFDVARLCVRAHRFIEKLSTWYVRRSRRRFYGEEWTADKRAAYSTLYEVLTTFNRVVAPILPFMSESMYQNLVAEQVPDSPRSVHHVPFPAARPVVVDDALGARVDALIRIVSLGRAARKESRLKVRQPLAELIVVTRDPTEREAIEVFREHVLEELNVLRVTLRDSGKGLVTHEVAADMKSLGPKLGRAAPAAKESIAGLDAGKVSAAFDSGERVSILVEEAEIELESTDVRIAKRYAEGWAGADGGATVVLVDTRITPELRRAGLAREIIRHVQNLRREAALDLGDRIRIAVVTDSPDIREVVGEHGDAIRREILAEEILWSPLPGEPVRRAVDIGESRLDLELIKVG
jgi:isoleucyl-tRNA synthetase